MTSVFALITNSPFSILVFVWLALYMVLTLGIFVSRFGLLSKWIKTENAAHNAFLQGESFDNEFSTLYGYDETVNCSAESWAKIQLEKAMQASSKGLTWLSIIASTSPFIGLFGTVVGILQAFSSFGSGLTINAIAPAISEALIATGVGIFVAIPAYSFHLILKRKAQEVVSVVKMQANLLVDAYR